MDTTNWLFEIALRGAGPDEWQLHTYGTETVVRGAAAQLRSRCNRLGYRTRVSKAQAS